jgi:hypothetical protein
MKEKLKNAIKTSKCRAFVTLSGHCPPTRVKLLAFGVKKRKFKGLQYRKQGLNF